MIDLPGETASDRIFVLGIGGADPKALRSDIRSLCSHTDSGDQWKVVALHRASDLSSGRTVHWRWINASDGGHPMHMHGSHFRVDSTGDGDSDHDSRLNSSAQL